MALEKLMETDVWVVIPGNSQLDNLNLIKDYVNAHSVRVARQDRTMYPFNEQAQFYAGGIYKFDIHVNHAMQTSNPKYGEWQALGSGAQFIFDEKRIILRAFYPLNIQYYRYSVNQRERIADDFLDFLIEKGIEISNE